MSDRAVEVVDVAPRDGLQILPHPLPTATRAELVRRLADAGVPRIEAVSFVHPARVPQMADAEDVVRRLPADGRAAICAMVLNERGYDRLVASGLREVRIALAVSDVFSERNSGFPTVTAVEVGRRILARAAADGIAAGVVLATAFGCPFSGKVDPGRVVSIAEQLTGAGAGEIVFADTIGVAVPGEVRRVLEGSAHLPATLGVHLHNTRNTGYANAFAAVEAGAVILDASVGGLGGCPFAPGATGNIATEDLVYQLERAGVSTGIDLDALVDVAVWLRDDVALDLDGQIHKVSRFPPAAVLS
jgi:hydroxymethylglutaryl-CoA lyase/(R)-citramalyl-CoA lyase